MVRIMDTYEKKYKEAQKWVESIYPNLSHEQQMEAEAFFPELCESEDEKIRRSLIHLVHLYGGEFGMIDTNTTVEKAITWLEKQGEQASAWSEEDREKIDETLYFIREYQQSNRCKDENGMQNSVTCKKWLKSLKERIGGRL